jgi:hypothetical protein
MIKIGATGFPFRLNLSPVSFNVESVDEEAVSDVKRSGICLASNDEKRYSNMKTCPNGHPVPDNAVFCTTCGARMPAASPGYGQPAQGQPYVYADQAPPNQGYQQPPYQQAPPYQQPPYGSPQGGMPLTGFRGEVRSPGMVILLSIITCGIYALFWLYSVSKEINNVLGYEATKPQYTFFGLLCFIFTLLLWSQVDDALIEIDRRRGIISSKKFLTWIVLSVLLGIGGFVMMYDVQSRLNALYEGRF